MRAERAYENLRTRHWMASRGLAASFSSSSAEPIATSTQTTDLLLSGAERSPRCSKPRVDDGFGC